MYNKIRINLKRVYSNEAENKFVVGSMEIQCDTCWIFTSVAANVYNLLHSDKYRFTH